MKSITELIKTMGQTYSLYMFTKTMKIFQTCKLNCFSPYVKEQNEAVNLWEQQTGRLQ